MLSKFLPTTFDYQVVREEIDRVLAQRFKEDDQLILTMGGFCIYLPVSPAHSKALAISLVLEAYPPHEWLWSFGGGVVSDLNNTYPQTMDQDLVTIDGLYGRGRLDSSSRPKTVKIEAIAQILRHWNCVS